MWPLQPWWTCTPSWSLHPCHKFWDFTGTSAHTMAVMNKLHNLLSTTVCYNIQYRFANQWQYVLRITDFTICSLYLMVNSQVWRADYTGRPGWNVPDFERMFLTLKYTDITQNTYTRSWTVTEITAREVWKYNSCYTLIDYQIHIKTARNM